MNEILQYANDHQWVYAVAVAASLPILGFLYFSAAALSNVESSYLKSLPIGIGTFYASCGIGWLIFLGMSKIEPGGGNFSRYQLLGGGLTILASWLVGLFTYLVVLGGQFGKSFKVSLFETLLRLFMIILLIGIGAVIAACFQVARTPDGSKMLQTLGIVVGCILGGFFFLFFATAFIRNRLAAR